MVLSVQFVLGVCQTWRSDGFMVSALLPGWSPKARLSKVPETFRARKAIAKSRPLRLQSCFIHKVNVNRRSLHTRSFRWIHPSVLDTDELKMALRARNALSPPPPPPLQPWPRILCCVLRQDTYLSQCLSPPRFIDGCEGI